MQLAGISLGTKYDHRTFMELVEHLPVVRCRSLAADTLGEQIPSLGIPSDFEDLKKVLRRRMSIVSGDGAVAGGGREAAV